MVCIRADHHENFRILGVEQVGVEVEKILVNSFLVDNEGVLKMLDANVGLSVCNIEQCKVVSDIFVDLRIGKVGITLLQDVDGDVLPMHDVAELGQPATVVQSVFEQAFGKYAELAERIFLTISAERVEYPL